MARNSLLVNRFYNEIAAGYECCKKQARIAGRVMRSVFIGWELRDEVYTSSNSRQNPKIPPARLIARV